MPRSLFEDAGLRKQRNARICRGVSDLELFNEAPRRDDGQPASRSSAFAQTAASMKMFAAQPPRSRGCAILLGEGCIAPLPRVDAEENQR